VRIPAGTCVIDLAKAPREFALGPYLVNLDPLRDAGEAFGPFPWDTARARVLAVGDRVEVLGQLVAIADGQGAGSYRELPETVLVPHGVPALRAADPAG
jgi:hypothetical protein